MILPEVQRIAPQLSRGGKTVGRAARHRHRIPVLIQLEQLRMVPCVGAVQRHIDGDIPNDADSLFIGIGLKRAPLLFKFHLEERVKAGLIRQFMLKRLHGLLLPETDILIPQCPGPALISVLNRHIKAVLHRLRPKSSFGLCRRMPLLLPPSICPAKQWKTV